jgi:hypothetical protein
MLRTLNIFSGGTHNKNAESETRNQKVKGRARMSMFVSARGFAGVGATALALFVSGCASVAPPSTGSTANKVTPFSAARGVEIVAGWQQWIMSRLLNRTEYRTVHEDGVPVIEARAESAASGLLQEVSIDPVEHKYISWRWKASSLIPGADNTRKGADDSPVRVIVAFDGDRKKFDFEDRAVADMVKLFSGREMPYATLMYIWENRQPVDTILENHNTSRAKMIVAESGDARVGQWLSFTRDIAEDYRKAFGEEPGRIISVGVMTDTNTTNSRVTSHYGDISFLTSLPTKNVQQLMPANANVAAGLGQ